MPRSVHLVVTLLALLAPAHLAGVQVESRDPFYSDTVDAPRGARGGALIAALAGSAAGLGLTVALVNAGGDGWMVSDEAALPLALGAGLTGAFLVRARSYGLDPDDPRRPRLRASGAIGDDMGWAYRLDYRTPVAERWDVEVGVLVETDDWTKVETETRCSWLFGCHTGPYVVDHRHEQSVSGIVRGAYHLAPQSVWQPTLTGGGGLALAHLEAEGMEGSTHAGGILDMAVGVAPGGRSRWTLEAGYRAVLIGDPEGGEFDLGGWYLATGFALGF